MSRQWISKGSIRGCQHPENWLWPLWHVPARTLRETSSVPSSDCGVLVLTWRGNSWPPRGPDHGQARPLSTTGVHTTGAWGVWQVQLIYVVDMDWLHVNMCCPTTLICIPVNPWVWRLTVWFVTCVPQSQEAELPLTLLTAPCGTLSTGKDTKLYEIWCWKYDLENGLL